MSHKQFAPTCRPNQPTKKSGSDSPEVHVPARVITTLFALIVAVSTFFTFSALQAQADSPGTNNWKFVQSLDFSWFVFEDSADQQSVDDNGLLTITPPQNGEVIATLQVDFTAQGNAAVNAGDVQIVIPRNVFATRDGVETRVDIGSETDYEEVTDHSYGSDYIVLTNKEDWGNDTKRRTFTVGYIVGRASDIIDSKEKDNLTLRIVYNGETDQADSILSCKVNTTARILRTTKTFEHVFTTWQGAWGDKPAEYDGTYQYVVFRVGAQVDDHANQPYTVSFEDTPQDGGKIVGYTELFQGTYGTFTTNTVLKQLNPTIEDTYVETPDGTINGSIVYAYAVVAYPIDTTLEEKEYHNQVKATVTPKDGVDDATYDEADAAFPYRRLEFTDPPGELYVLTKRGFTNRAGGITRILSGNDVDMLGYSMRAGALNFTNRPGAPDGEPKYSWGKEFRAELIDDAFYIQDTNGTPRLLTSEDYEIHVVEPMFHMWTWEPDYTEGKYKETSYADYDNYPIITAYGKKSENGEWIELGTFKYENVAGGPYGYRLVATSTNGDATATTVSTTSDGRLELAEGSGYVGVRFSAVANAGKTEDDNQGIISMYFSGNNPNVTSSSSSLDTAIYIRLKPSDFVKEVAQAASDNAAANAEGSTESPKAQVFIDNFNTLAVYDNNSQLVGFKTSGEGYDSQMYGELLKQHDSAAGLGDPMAHRIGTDSILEYKYRSETKKTAKIKNDKANSRVRVTYTVTGAEYFDADDNDKAEDLIASGEYKPHNEGYIYDLLPAGMTIDESSAVGIGSFDYTYSLNNTNVQVVEIKQYPNYKDSGRTLVAFKLRADGDNYLTTKMIYGTNWTAYSRLGVQFDAYYGWDQITLHGNVLYNMMAFETANDWIYNGRNNEPETGDVEDSYLDVMAGLSPDGEEGEPDLDNPAFLYGHATTSVNVTMSAATGLSKTVAGPHSGGYGTGRIDDRDILVPTAGQYSYQLMFMGESTKTGDIVVYDSLENLVPDAVNHDDEDVDSVRWRGTFQGVNVSQPTDLGIDVKVFYTTKEGLLINETVDQDKLDESDANVDNSAIWKELTGEESDELKAQITGLAFDLRKTTDGKDFFLDEGAAIGLYINMQAPTDSDTVRQLVSDAEATGEGITKVPHAYNGVSMRNKLYGASGETTKNAMITYDYTRVGLYIPTSTLEVAKVAEFPEDFTEEEIAAFNDREFTITITDADGNPFKGRYAIRDARSGYYYANTGASDLFVRMDAPNDIYFVAGRDYGEDQNNQEKVKYADREGSIYDPDRGLDEEGNPKTRVYYKRIQAAYEDYTFETSDGVLTVKPGQVFALYGLEGDIKWKAVEEEGDYTATVARESEEPAEGGTIDLDPLGDNNVVQVTFTNKPPEGPQFGSLEISKTVASGDTNLSFTFTVTLTDAEGTALEGEFNYTGASEGTIASGGTVQLKDGQSITIAGLPAGTKYEVVETLPEGYDEPVKTDDTGVIKTNATASASFENKLTPAEDKPAPGSVQFSVKKTLVGRDWNGEDAFNFTLSAKDGAPMPASAEGARGTATKDTPKVRFGEITFTTADLAGASEKTFVYTIDEENGGKTIDNMTYDTGKQVRVTVAETEQGAVEITSVEYSANGGKRWTSTNGEVEFINVYTPPTKDEPQKPGSPSRGDLPNTGDEAPFVTCASLLALGAVGMFIARKRRKA